MFRPALVLLLCLWLVVGFAVSHPATHAGPLMGRAVATAKISTAVTTPRPPNETWPGLTQAGWALLEQLGLFAASVVNHLPPSVLGVVLLVNALLVGRGLGLMACSAKSG